MTLTNHEYLGDGVYAAVEDGFQIALSVNDHRNPPAVYLDVRVLARLVDYAKQHGLLK